MRKWFRWGGLIFYILGIRRGKKEDNKWIIMVKKGKKYMEMKSQKLLLLAFQNQNGY